MIVSYIRLYHIPLEKVRCTPTLSNHVSVHLSMIMIQKDDRVRQYCDIQIQRFFLMLLYIYYTHRLSNTVRIQTRQEVKSRVLSTSHFHQSDPARKWSASQFLLIDALLNTDLCSLDVMPSSVFKMSSSNSVIISPDICSRANTSVYCVRSIASNKALT